MGTAKRTICPTGHPTFVAGFGGKGYEDGKGLKGAMVEQGWHG